MQPGKILSSAIVSTTAMTLFSHFVSQFKSKNFSEPDVLKQLVKRMPNHISKESAEIAGWFMHYGIGVFFELLFIEFWKRYKIKPSVTSGTLLGVMSGLMGIVAWQVMFKIHPNPPAKNLKKYFGHLILAHMVFGGFSAMFNNSKPTDRHVFVE